MKQLFQILDNRQNRTVITPRKGKQGNPRNLPAYCLEEVYKPQRKEREPKTEPGRLAELVKRQTFKGAKGARICKALDQRKDSWTERGIQKSAVGSPRSSDKFQTINIYVRRNSMEPGENTLESNRNHKYHTGEIVFH